MKELAIYKKSLSSIAVKLKSHGITNSKDLNEKSLLGLQSNLEKNSTSSYKTPDGIQIIQIKSELVRYGDYFSSWYGMVSYDSIYDQIEKANLDQSVKAILLLLDSPGGEVNGNFELTEYIRASKKPVYSYASYLCASACYSIASSTKRIYAHDSAWIGSIGIIAVFEDWTSMLEEYGIKIYQFVSDISPNKNLSPGTEEGADSIQEKVNVTGNMFIDLVAKYRNISREKVIKEFGQGDILSAKRAEKVGMIDKSGYNLQQVIEEIRTELNQGDTTMGLGMNTNEEESTLTDEEKEAKKKAQEEEEEKAKKAKAEKDKEDEMEEDKDEDEMEEDKDKESSKSESDKKEEAKIKALVASKVQAVLKQERIRNEGIDKIQAAYPAYSKLISQARKDGMSVADLSLKIFQEETAAKESFSKGYFEDAKKLPTVSGSSGKTSEEKQEQGLDAAFANSFKKFNPTAGIK